MRGLLSFAARSLGAMRVIIVAAVALTWTTLVLGAASSGLPLAIWVHNENAIWYRWYAVALMGLSTGVLLTFHLKEKSGALMIGLPRMICRQVIAAARCAPFLVPMFFIGTALESRVVVFGVYSFVFVILPLWAAGLSGSEETDVRPRAASGRYRSSDSPYTAHTPEEQWKRERGHAGSSLIGMWVTGSRATGRGADPIDG